jgi:hypothetical protein
MAINRGSDTTSNTVRQAYNQNITSKGLKIPTGIYRGIVVDTADPKKMGRIKVQIIKFYGTMPVNAAATNQVDPDEYLGAMWCRQMMPMGGVTAPDGGGQSIYGMIGQPPSVNNEVIVAFSGDSHAGIVLGVMPDDGKLGGGAGAGVSALTTEGTFTIAQEVPKTATDPNQKPAEHPQAAILRTQGLETDRIRGQNFSSPLRDPTNRVMGITTPIGHSLALDDGSLEDGSSLGVRLRSAGGGQILIDDTNGLIYIINQTGSSWIEMNRMGDIDMFCAGSLNINTIGDFNLHCGGKINAQSSQGVNIKSTGADGISLDSSTGAINLYANTDFNLQADGNGNIKIAGNYRETAKRIDMNGPVAASATRPNPVQLVGNIKVTESIATRVPEAEPWGGHLDVSILDQGSASGTASVSGSDTYYYGSPVNPSLYNEQTGTYDDPNYQASMSSTILTWAPGKDQRVDPALIALVEEVCRRFGRPATINSGFRSPTYNAKVSGAKRSQHMIGKAVDITFGGSPLTATEKNRVIAIASAVGIKGIGIYNSSFHFDNRDGASTGWGADYTGASVPDFASTIMSTHRSGGFA